MTIASVGGAFLVLDAFRVALAADLVVFRPFGADMIPPVTLENTLSSCPAGASPKDINDGASENAVRLDCVDRREAFDAREVRPCLPLVTGLESANSSESRKKRQSGDLRRCSLRGSSLGSQPSNERSQ